MPSTGLGQSPKKETIYSGPTSAAGGTAGYGGGATKPVKETIYGGPSTGGTVYSPAQGTDTRSAKTAVGDNSGKTANVFFLIAAFSLINILLLSSGAMVATAIGLGVTRVVFNHALSSGGETGAVFFLSAALIAVFVALGVFARRGSSVAFLIGLLLYGADTAVLCWDGVAVHIPSIVVHGIFLAGMFKGYRLTQE